MFLKNIRLTAFKCHESLVVDFSPGAEDTHPVRKATFLTGETGSGKTALLQAIAIVTGGSAVLRSIPGFPDDFILLRKRSALIEASLLTPEGEELEIAIRFTRGLSTAGILAQNKVALAVIDGLLNRPKGNYFTAGYGAGRKPGMPGKVNRLLSLGFSAVQSLFGMAEIPGILPGDSRQILKQALDIFLPPEIRLKGATSNSREFLFATPDGTLPLGMLAGGYQQTVSWLNSLLYEASRRPSPPRNPFKARGLLLISEIDLHLHPVWQRFIPQLLREFLPNFQIIATTYSPHVAQQAGPGELYALRRDDGKVKLIPFQGDPSRMLLHQLLMSPMFGLETDESLNVERAKAAVREAAISGSPHATESFVRSASESALKYLPDTVNTRSNSGVAGEDIALLQAINAALQSGKKGGRK